LESHFMKTPHIFSVLCVSFLLLACSGNKIMNGSLNEQGIPAWVNDGSSILKSKENRLFHGVSSASMIGNFSLQTSTANRRAREEMTRIVTSFMEIVSREYIATGQASHAGFNEQEALKHITVLREMDLSKVEVVGHWADDEARKIYAITQMDMEEVRRVIKESVSVNKGLKAFMNIEGDRIFDRIAKKVE